MRKYLMGYIARVRKLTILGEKKYDMSLSCNRSMKSAEPVEFFLCPLPAGRKRFLYRE